MRFAAEACILGVKLVEGGLVAAGGACTLAATDLEWLLAHTWNLAKRTAQLELAEHTTLLHRAAAVLALALPDGTVDNMRWAYAGFVGASGYALAIAENVCGWQRCLQVSMSDASDAYQSAAEEACHSKYVCSPGWRSRLLTTSTGKFKPVLACRVSALPCMLTGGVWWLQEATEPDADTPSLSMAEELLARACEARRRLERHPRYLASESDLAMNRIEAERTFDAARLRGDAVAVRAALQQLHGTAGVDAGQLFGKAFALHGARAWLAKFPSGACPGILDTRCACGNGQWQDFLHNASAFVLGDGAQGLVNQCAAP